MNNKNKISLNKWIWLSYLKTALIPLILVELVFIGIYFMTNNWSRHETNSLLKTEVNTEVAQIARLEASVIERQLLSIASTTQTFAEQTAEALSTKAQLSPEDVKRLAYTENGIYYTTKDSGAGGAAVFYSGYSPIGAGEREKVARVLQTQGLMKSIQSNNPLIASVYLNTFDSLNVIYPYLEVLSQYTPFINIPTFNFYYEADAEHNPERTIQWTDVYLDPAGHGWMASCIAPVYHGDFLEGVVGIDVTVSTITEQVLHMDTPWDGYGLLLGEDGTILALPSKGEKDWGLDELTNHSYSQAILEDTFKPEQYNLYHREALSGLTQRLANQTEGVFQLALNGDQRIVSWNTIGETGWKLLLIVSEDSIYAGVNEMSARLFDIGLLMVTGLILFYAVFFVVLYQRSRKMSLFISEPLQAVNEMVCKIGAGDYYQQAHEYAVTELAETARNLVQMGVHLGTANQELLKTQRRLKENEAYQNTLINSLDDVILEADEGGHFLSIRTSDQRNLAVEYEKNGNDTVQSLMGEETARYYLEALRNVIQTGNSETVEYQMETGNGVRWFQARISLMGGSEKAVISARDITERKRMEQSLLDAKIEAEKASQAKSQFLSNMSHELRTPLNAVLGFAQLLNMNVNEPLSADQQEFVMEIEKAGKHLLELINEILDLARIESGKTTISCESVSVADVMEDTLAMIKPMADRFGITIISPVCENRFANIKADFMRIKQVLINLLNNAVKYNKENGRIDYFCERLESTLRFHIIDTGEGIPETELQRIFEPFYRISEKSNETEGTGIGLSMVKQLTAMMGGSVFVESELGKGSHFYVEMPLAEEGLTICHVRSQTWEAGITDGVRESHTILYIEDNPANLSLIRHVLQPFTHIKLITASDGETGISIAQGRKLDLIMLDINLPNMDGYEVMKILRSIPSLAGINMIAISANAMERDIKKALRLGFDDYITKPINVKEFLQKINGILRKK